MIKFLRNIVEVKANEFSATANYKDFKNNFPTAKKGAYNAETKEIEIFFKADNETVLELLELKLITEEDLNKRLAGVVRLYKKNLERTISEIKELKTFTAFESKNSTVIGYVESNRFDCSLEIHSVNGLEVSKIVIK